MESIVKETMAEWNKRQTPPRGLAPLGRASPLGINVLHTTTHYLIDAENDVYPRSVVGRWSVDQV